MQLIYNKYDGKIDVILSDSQDYKIYYKFFPNEFIESLSAMNISDEDIPKRLEDYRVIDGNLIRLSELEIKEIERYGKVLSEEERTLESMKPSIEEVRDAEKTIELLTLLQEVL